MNFLAHALRRFGIAVALGSAVLLASCGGGDPVEAFVPRRVLAFGDENSVITSDARKYTINALATDATTSTINCAANPLWVQRLASAFGLVFPDCNPDGVSDPASLIYAANGATVADLALQIDQHLAADSFSSKDLVTLFVGQNDVLAAYLQYDGTNSAALLSAVYQAGQALAAQAVRVANAGGKVLVLGIPDVSLTPFALAENAAAGDTSRTTLLLALDMKFNEGLRLGLIGQSGSQIALMLPDELIQRMVTYPGSYGSMTNVIAAACDAALAPSVLQCTTETLVSGATASNYLWADSLHLSPNGHTYLGSAAIAQVQKNNF